MQAGVILPDSAKDGSFDRDMVMADEVEALLERERPAVILVEWTKGKVNINRHKGHGAGLAVYGTGVGSVGRQCWLWSRERPDVQVHAINENDWTRGVPKGQRQLAIASMYPEYAPHLAADTGGDISDAIGLAAWWLREGLFAGQ